MNEKQILDLQQKLELLDKEIKSEKARSRKHRKLSSLSEGASPFNSSPIYSKNKSKSYESFSSPEENPYVPFVINKQS